MSRVRRHHDFRQDIRSQLLWIHQHRDRACVERLRDGLAEATELLARLPGIGAPIARAGRTTLRTLILRRLPYVIWYLEDTKAGEVWLLRLFHAHQERPHPDLGRWRR